LFVDVLILRSSVKLITGVSKSTEVFASKVIVPVPDPALSD